LESPLKSEPTSFYAGLARLGIGAIAVFGLPLVFPGLNADRWVFGIYVAWALVLQVMIARGVGGMARAVAGALVDVLAATYLGHLMGSVTAIVVSIYFIAVTLNTVAVGPRVGIFVAALSSVAYTATVLLEATGRLPYGPAAPSWAAAGTPPVRDALVATLMVSGLVFGCAFIVVRVLGVLRQREEQLVQANHRLEALSKLDPLTQIYNRRHLVERIEEELQWVGRGRSMAVIMIDLDRFKRMNDERGHLAGDALLRKLSEAIAECARRTDVVGRYGGDEFVVLLPDTDASSARAAAFRMVEEVRAASTRFDPDVLVTASGGIGVARDDDTVQSLLERADRAAYEAKQDGGDRVAA